MRGMLRDVESLYSHGPVPDQTEFERGRESGLNEVVRIINEKLNTRQAYLAGQQSRPWFQIKNPDELSIGQDYFYHIAGEQTQIAEFDGEGFSCEAECFVLDEIDLSKIWFMEFECPKPPEGD